MEQTTESDGEKCSYHSRVCQRQAYDFYRMLIVEQSWKPQRYETWLGQLLVQHLLVSR